jgi:hypothetical protein
MPLDQALLRVSQCRQPPEADKRRLTGSAVFAQSRPNGVKCEHRLFFSGFGPSSLKGIVGKARFYFRECGFKGPCSQIEITKFLGLLSYNLLHFIMEADTTRPFRSIDRKCPIKVIDDDMKYEGSTGWRNHERTIRSARGRPASFHRCIPWCSTLTWEKPAARRVRAATAERLSVRQSEHSTA